jgi:uncharacterized membrane protein YfcA
VLFLLLAVLGLIGGFLSGLLGIGGGIVMVPLLLYVPPRLGVAAFDIRAVAGMTIVQVFAAALLGYLIHRQRQPGYGPVVRWMGPSMVLGTAIGGVLSRYVTLALLEGVFILLALVATPLLFREPLADEAGEGPAARFSGPLAAGTALVIGVLSGLVGVGGAFLLIPVMIYLLGVPTRAAIASSLGVIFMSSAAGLVAKLATGQVSLPWATALVAGALPGSWSGAQISRRVPARRLRLVMATLVALTALRMLLDLVETLRLTTAQAPGS